MKAQMKKYHGFLLETWPTCQSLKNFFINIILKSQTSSWYTVEGFLCSYSSDSLISCHIIFSYLTCIISSLNFCSQFPLLNSVLHFLSQCLFSFSSLGFLP